MQVDDTNRKEKSCLCNIFIMIYFSDKKLLSFEFKKNMAQGLDSSQMTG